MHALFSQLQDTLKVSKETVTPSVETVFGGEAISPIVPPMYFNLSEDQRNFEAQLGPWRLTREEILAKMLRRDASQIKPDTFDAIFKFDEDQLRRKAACDALKYDDLLQSQVSERMSKELDYIEEQLGVNTNIELTNAHLDIKANINVASGQLQEFTFNEPPELFTLDPDFEGNPDEIVL